MLDVARHFFGVDDVKKFIDSTSALKLNHLHLHLSDDQGWRVHIDSWPRLTELSAGTSANGDPGGFYSKDDYREIVAYAASRHMIVIPEIDLPGHTHAIGVAYPELVEEPVMNDNLIADSERLGRRCRSPARATWAGASDTPACASTRSARTTSCATSSVSWPR